MTAYATARRNKTVPKITPAHTLTRQLELP